MPPRTFAVSPHQAGYAGSLRSASQPVTAAPSGQASRKPALGPANTPSPPRPPASSGRPAATRNRNTSSAAPAARRRRPGGHEDQEDQQRRAATPPAEHRARQHDAEGLQRDRHRVAER